MKGAEAVAAEVRPAEDLAALARRINAEHEAAEGLTREGLEHYRAAGEALIRAKKQIGHGGWLKWVANNVKCKERQARKYMRLAREWESVKSALDADLGIDKALRYLTEDADEPPRATLYSDMLETYTSKVLGQTFYIDQELGGIENIVAETDKWDWVQVRDGTLPKLRAAHEKLGRYIGELEHGAKENLEDV